MYIYTYVYIYIYIFVSYIMSPKMSLRRNVWFSTGFWVILFSDKPLLFSGIFGANKLIVSLRTGWNGPLFGCPLWTCIGLAWLEWSVSENRTLPQQIAVWCWNIIHSQADLGYTQTLKKTEYLALTYLAEFRDFSSSQPSQSSWAFISTPLAPVISKNIGISTFKTLPNTTWGCIPHN